MKKIIVFLLVLMVCHNSAVAQATIITKNYSAANITKLNLKFDYPKIVKLETWDKNEVAVTANVSINDGENNDVFTIQETTTNNELSIEAKVANVDELPKKYILKHKGVSNKFNSKAEIDKFINENNIHQSYRYGQNVDIEIQVTVFVPKKLSTNVTNTYGLIEIKNFAAPLVANSPYSGVDVTITKEDIGKLSAQTNYGEILTDIDFDIEEKETKDFYTYFKANVGNGFNYKLTSKYGKLYLRKK